MKPWMSARTSSVRRADRDITASQLPQQVDNRTGRSVRTGACERAIVDDIQHRLLRIRAVEHLGRHLMAPQELFESGQISGAVRGISIRAFPDRVQPGEDQLGELVDIA